MQFEAGCRNVSVSVIVNRTSNKGITKHTSRQSLTTSGFISPRPPLKAADLWILFFSKRYSVSFLSFAFHFKEKCNSYMAKTYLKNKIYFNRQHFQCFSTPTPTPPRWQTLRPQGKILDPPLLTFVFLYLDVRDSV